jgi:PLP dependent protein
LQDFGENRVQEASAKMSELADLRASFQLHLVGHLQTNKAEDAIEICDIIHSVDSVHLARAINKHALKKSRVLVQVNVSGERTKYGFPVDDLSKSIEDMGALANIEILGLMTVAPMVSDPEEVRPVFSTLRNLNSNFGFRELSMGMTDDYEIAIEEGATMIRIGRAIFGKRS